MDESTAVCGWCGKDVPLLDSGRLKIHFPLEQPNKHCQGSIEFPADTLIEAAAERLGRAAPRLLESLQEALHDARHAEACCWWDIRSHSGLIHQGGVCTCWIGRATEAIAAATVRPQT